MWKTTVDRPKRANDTQRVAVVRVLGAEGSTHHVFRGRELLIGRAVGADGLWFPDDERVSRRHAVLRFDQTRSSASIEDLSRSGTFVQGRKVTHAPVQEGDVVRVGDSFFLLRFLSEDQLAEAEESADSALIGPSPALTSIRRALTLVGNSAASVVILGESGTGKELAARALHERSGRRGAFVPVNCGAIPEALMESLFFGHVAGAFTGAKGEGRGWFRAADGGTLFLDEIGELPLLLQPKLLRAVEDRAVTPVGATEPVAGDVRIVAATHRDLGDRERFRGDLCARLCEFVLEIPPLRARREDILPILSRQLAHRAAALDAELVELLLLHDYPHNARDLRRVATQLSVRGAGRDVWDASLLDQALTSSVPAAADAAESPTNEDEARDEGHVPTRDELSALLRAHRGVVANIARETGRSRKQVYRWLARHQLAIEDYRSE